ncbi:PDDEXK-like family protein [Acidisoma sp. 7E03]
MTDHSEKPEPSPPCPVSPALVGKAGEVLVAGELLRRGIEVAYPASDRGIDLLAYRLTGPDAMARSFVPIQVKTRAASGFYFHRSWFEKVPGLVLVHVWHVTTTPAQYVFGSLADVEEALGDYAKSPSWTQGGVYNVTKASDDHYKRMEPFRNRWHVVSERLV